MIYNNLRAELYARSSTTRIIDPSGDLDRVRDVQFDTFYPGGLYGQCSFTARRKLVEWWALQGAYRLALVNGQSIVWEGLVDNLQAQMAGPNEQVRVTGTGWWGALAMRRRWRKRWADTRLDADTWSEQSEAEGVISNVERVTVTVERSTGLRFKPQSGEDWANGEYFAVRYTVPTETSEEIKRIAFTWKFSEGAQVWQAQLWDVTNARSIWSWSSTDTTGTSRDDDLTLLTPQNSKCLEFRLISLAAQTTPDDQSIHLYIYDLTVYGETGSINSTEIIKDVRGYLTECNADDTLIGSNTYALSHFVADAWETVGDTMIRAASYGDSNQDAWAVGMRHSESVTTPNGEPVIFYELVPALTDYDYAVRLAELAAPVGITRDFSKIANWLVLRYKNEFKKDAYITPTTDATLGDTTSQTAYGRRDVPEKILSWGEATQANAINLARRYLEQHKDPVYNLSGALQIPRYVRAKGGNLVPASEIMAGKRIMIEDFLDDLSGTGLTWLITKTTYNDETQICSVQTGTPDPLAILLARLKLIVDRFEGIEFV